MEEHAQMDETSPISFGNLALHALTDRIAVFELIVERLIAWKKIIATWEHRLY
jgi:hypothetical protein